MIKFSELKLGDFVLCEYEGKMWEGEVTRLNGDEKQIEVTTDVQAFWFDQEHLHPILLDDDEMQKLSFTRHMNEDGSTKYMKGAFRVLLPKHKDFSKMEIWYREDKRHNPNITHVHQLQNHYLDMTKVHLTKELV